MKSSGAFNKLMNVVVTHVVAYEKRERSRAEKDYSSAMQNSAAALTKFIRVASFDEILRAEKTFQENDRAIYAKHSATMKAVQESIDDFADGEAAYRQLVENTAAYKEHAYRRKERIPPEKILPLDAMRRALRGQVKRVGNYRSNVMGNSQEQEFLSARIAMLRRAEDLYDGIQRERLL